MTPETRIKIWNVARSTNISKIYSKKLVRYGDVVEITEYKRPRVTTKRGNKFVERKSSGTRTIQSVLRAKNRLFRLVLNNAGKWGPYPTTFWTLTFEEEIEDLTLANYHFKKAMQRLKWYMKSSPAYVAVPEIQEERYEKYGVKVWHFHVVFFNLPYIPFEDLHSIWGHGFDRIEKVKGVNHMPAYLAKYFQKACKAPELFGRRSYFTSRGLIKPLELFGEKLVDEFLEYATLQPSDEKFENDELIHSKYTIC